MSKKLKAISLMMALAMVAGAATGCSSSESSSSSQTPSSETTSSATETSSSGESSSAEGSGEDLNVGESVEFLIQYSKEKETLYQILDEFETAYNTELVIQNIPNMPELLKQLNIMVAGNSLPDVADIDAPYLGAYVEMGVIADITDRVTSELPVDQYYEGTMEAVMVDDKYYGLPFSANCVALYYNKDMFAEAGLEGPAETWDELLEQAKTLTKDGVYGFTTSATATMDGTFRYYPVMWANGADIDSFGSDANIKTLQWFSDMATSGSMSTEVANWAPNDSIGRFINGNAAMALDGPWQLNSVEEGAQFEWGVALLPKGDAGVATCLGGHVFVAMEGHNEDGAWALMKWFQDPERMERFNKDEGYLPARKDVREGSDVFTTGNLGVFAAAMEDAKARGPRADWPEVEVVTQEMMQSVIIGEKTPEQAAADAATAMEAILAD